MLAWKVVHYMLDRQACNQLESVLIYARPTGRTDFGGHKPDSIGIRSKGSYYYIEESLDS